MMKMRILTFVAFCAVLFFMESCAASRVAKNSPAGTWNYTVKNTPDGTLTGTMNIQQNGEGYTGNLSSNDGKVDLNNVTIEDNQLTSNFYIQGTYLELKGAFSGDTFTGSVDAGGQSFPVEATRATME
jgi:hypothetical protein